MVCFRHNHLPVPSRLTTWGLSGALSVIVSFPLRFPFCVGVKVTLMVQLPPTARRLPQLLVCAKSPVVVMLLMGKPALLVKVTTVGALLVCTGCGGNPRNRVERRIQCPKTPTPVVVPT